MAVLRRLLSQMHRKMIAFRLYIYETSIVTDSAIL